jgi:hypothetical protein
MTDAEREIIEFLKHSPDTWFHRKEISRKARRRSEYEEDPHWANAPLASLVDQKHVLQNDSGLYQISPNFDR